MRINREVRAAATATRETRSGISGEFREVAGKERTFRARVCNYNVPDSYRTSWAPGVFSRSLTNKLPKAVWSHDWNRPIGKVVDYIDGPDGLDVEVQFADFDAVPDARMAHSLLKDGIIDNFSFGFVRKADEPDPDHRGVTRITDVDLDEISPVLVGSVPGTHTLSVRSAEQIPAQQAADILVKFGAGELDLADALTSLKNGTRALVTEAGLPKNSNGTPDVNMTFTKAAKKTMRSTPHVYTPTTGDGSLCATCGGLTTHKSHTNRAATPTEIRDLSLSITSTVDSTDTEDTPEDLIAATDAAIDAAIKLASYQDLTNLPWWVSQMLALIMAADCSVDAAMATLNIPDPDEQVVDGMVRALTEGRETRSVEKTEDMPEDDPELRSALDKLGHVDGLEIRADVTYADPKNKKYDISSYATTKAAWSYVNMPRNASQYPLNGVTLTEVKNKIKTAAKKFGITIND